MLYSKVNLDYNSLKDSTRDRFKFCVNVKN